MRVTLLDMYDILDPPFHTCSVLIIEDVRKYLASAITTIIQTINPGIIILGGLVAQAGDQLIQPL